MMVKLKPVFAVASLAYMAYFAVDYIREMDKIPSWRQTAFQKADTNKNDELEVEEVLTVYRKLGLDGKTIVRHLYNSPAVRDEETKNRFLREYGVKDEYCPRCKVDHHPKFYFEDVANINRDDTVDNAEAEKAFKIVYERKSIAVTDFLSPYNPHVDNRFTFMLYALLGPHRISKGSELDRYVENGR